MHLWFLTFFCQSKLINYQLNILLDSYFFSFVFNFKINKSPCLKNYNIRLCNWVLRNSDKMIKHINTYISFDVDCIWAINIYFVKVIIAINMTREYLLWPNIYMNYLEYVTRLFVFNRGWSFFLCNLMVNFAYLNYSKSLIPLLYFK